MADNEEERQPSTASRWALKALEEVGIMPVVRAHRDTKLLMLQRFVRLFAYGGSTLILVSYLSDIGNSESRTGLFMSLTLAGDVLISFCLTLVADALGRRVILGLGAALMAASGIVFSLTENYWLLLAAAILGVITPRQVTDSLYQACDGTGNEIGPFRAIEESVLAHLNDKHDRPSIFAWYALVGTFGSALGLITCGWLLTLLVERKDWSRVETYHLIFVIYAAIGVVKLVLTLLLSSDCELEKPQPGPSGTETAPLLQEDGATPKKKPRKFAMLPQLSRESRVILVQLCALFALDNFASGLVPLSWLSYYFKRRFNLAEGKIGTLFFVTSIISAISILFAASLARRIGNVRTMVFTHLPSSVCLALIGVPSQLPLAMMLLVIRACTQSMDTAPRAAFLSAIVLPNERTATMGTVNVVRTISQGLGPLITGLLVGKSLFWVAFLMAGSLKVTYDIGMLLMFVGHKAREDREHESVDQ